MGDDDVFYSSAPETGMDSGDYINDKVFQNLRDSNYVLFLLSPRYFDSHYCMCEMGAAKVLNKKPFIIFLPDMSKDDFKGVYEENLYLRLNEDTLNQLVQSVRENCKEICREDNIAGFRRAIQKCNNELPAAIASLPPRKSVSIAEHDRLKAENAALGKLLDASEEDVKRQSAIIKDLEAGRTLKEAQKAHRPGGVKKVFEEVWENAINELGKLSSDGEKAFFLLYTQDYPTASRMINDRRLELDDEVVRKLIDASNGYYELLDKAQPIKDAINKLENFINIDNADRLGMEYNFSAKEYYDFLDWFGAELDAPLDIEDKDFWDAALFSTSHVKKILK